MQSAQGQNQNGGGDKSSIVEQLMEELKKHMGSPENQIGRPSSNEAAPQIEGKKDEAGIPRTTLTSS